MLGLLKRIFAPDPTPQESQQRVPLAALVLLVEIAAADGEFSDAERSGILPLFCDFFSVSTTEAESLLQEALELQRESVDLHQFTQQLHAAFSAEEKLRLVDVFWQLCFADGRLDAHEERVMRQLGPLLGVSHRQLMDAKLRIRNQSRQA